MFRRNRSSGGIAPRRRAEGDQQPARREAAERVLDRVLADGVVDHGNARATGEAADFAGKIAAAIDHDVIAAMRPRDRRFSLAADAADDPDTEVPRPLAHEDADAARSREHQNSLAGSHLVCREKQIVRREALGDDRRRGFIGDVRRQGDQAIRRHQAPVRVGAEGCGGIGDAVADLDLGHLRADRLDHAGRLEADRRWVVRQRIAAGAMLDVDVVETDRVLHEPHFARARRAHLVALVAEHLGAARPRHEDTVGTHLRWSWSCRRPCR